MRAGLSDAPIRADGQLTSGTCSLQASWAACLQCLVPACLFAVTSHRTSATTLSAAGAGSDNSPTRVMSSMECSVMYLE